MMGRMKRIWDLRMHELTSIVPNRSNIYAMRPPRHVIMIMGFPPKRSSMIIGGIMDISKTLAYRN
jgi:hypothetical protein